MYTHFFGLSENPFALPPDPRYLYLSLRHQEALAHLMFGITQAGGFVQLTGEVGTGKTMMLRALLERLPDHVDVTLVLYPFLSVEEFLAAICDDLRVPRPDKPGVKALIDALNQYLLDNHAKGRRTVLVIDEAQNLSHEVLEQVRLLTNLETTKEKLLQILLVGQPELNSLLAQRDLRQLAQRITAHYNLKALSPRETAEYVLHRLRVARARSPLFTRSALAAIHRLSGGTPRLINILGDRALLGAYARGKNRVTASFVRQASTEIGRRPRSHYALAGGAAAALVAGVSFASWQLIARDAPTAVSPVVASAIAPAATPVVATDTAAAASPVERSEAAPTKSLESLLRDPATVFDTESAFAALFAQWRKDYERLPGNTGCERALSAGLRCAYGAGNWNNLRQLNRPAVIELMDTQSNRYHVLLSGLNDDRAVLEIDGQAHEVPIAEVDRYWFGKFLVLWSPPPSGEQTLRRGMRGPAVVWLREAIARADGRLPESRRNLFDAELEQEVKLFQRKHRLADDGVVGRSTLIQLDGYDAGGVPPLLSKTDDALAP